MRFSKRSQAVLAFCASASLALVLTAQTAGTFSYLDANLSGSELLSFGHARAATGQVLGASTPAFVQQNYATPQTNQSAVTLKYIAAQTAGDTNILAIGWNDTTSNITAVSDSAGNSYQVAVPTFRGTALSQAIYYAKNIKASAANANTVTVTFSTAVFAADVRALEYKGLDQTSPFDIGASAKGSSASPNSGSVTTTGSTELIFGADMTAGNTNNSGSGFTKRVITSPDSDLAEDKIATATGSFNATAATTNSAWVMQMAGFKAAGLVVDTTPPSIPTNLAATAVSPTQINLSWTISTDNIGVTGYKIYRAGLQVATTAVASYSDAGLSANTTYTYTVAAFDAAGNLSGQSSSASATTQSLPVPVISSFTANPTSIFSAQSSTLSWNVSGASSISIDNGIGSVPAQASHPVTPMSTTTYTLTAVNSSGTSTAQTTVAVSADTQAPTIPQNLSATAVSTSQINLSWTASSDNVGVAGYNIFRNGSQVAQVTVTSFQDTGLSASTNYSYTVSAFDAAGNNSAQSTLASATTQAQTGDTTPPSTPTNLSATAISSSAINLTWTASTDNIGVTGYSIYRGGVQIATSATNSYSDTGLSASTQYTYTVNAYDAAGNNSSQSSPASATTQGGGGSGTATLQNWGDSPVAAWSDVAGGSAGANTVSMTANIHAVGDLVAVTAWCINVTFTGGCTPASTAVTLGNQVAQVTSVAGLSDPHSSGQGWIYYVSSAAVAGQQTLTFNTVENVQLQVTYMDFSPSAGFVFQHDVDSPLGYWDGNTSDGNTFNFTSPSITPTPGDLLFNFTMTEGHMVDPIGSPWAGVIYPETFSHFFQQSVDTAAYVLSAPSGSTANNLWELHHGNSMQGLITSFKLVNGSADTQAPSSPTNLSATAISSSAINLSWTVATDNVGVAGYQVFRDGLQIATTTQLNYSDAGLAAQTSYAYNVTAFDAVGNISVQSSPATAMTSAVDTTPPSVPTNLQSSNITSSSATISWTASTDNVVVAGYQIYRNGSLVTATSQTSYTDVGLSASTNYSYTVNAYDASSNFSDQSQPLFITTTNTPPATPAFVKLTEAVATASSNNIVTPNFGSAVASGNAIIVRVWYGSTSQSISSVTDSLGNIYAKAIGPTTGTGAMSGWRQEIWYAKNVIGGSGLKVTATFTGTFNAEKSLTAHEYSGLDQTSPLDVAAGSAGSAANASSSVATTNFSKELIFGADLFQGSGAAGSGFTLRSSLNANASEDEVVSTAGSYAATFSNSAQSSIAQMATFKAAGQ